MKAHGEQRYGDQPYVYHLDGVAGLLLPYGRTAQVIGYLHDVVEDTPVTVADIERTFGGLIAQCVALLTDEPGETRAARKAKTYAKLALVTGETELNTQNHLSA